MSTWKQLLLSVDAVLLFWVIYFVGFDKGVHDGMCAMAREFRAEGKIDPRIPERACKPWEFLKVDGKEISNGR